MKAQILFNQIYSLDPQTPVEVYDTDSGIFKKVIDIKIGKDANLHVFVTEGESKTLNVSHFIEVLINYLDAQIKIIDKKFNMQSKPVKVQMYVDKNILTDKTRQGVFLHSVY